MEKFYTDEREFFAKAARTGRALRNAIVRALPYGVDVVPRDASEERTCYSLNNADLRCYMARALAGGKPEISAYELSVRVQEARDEYVRILALQDQKIRVWATDQLFEQLTNACSIR
jgi:hypothetical protein